MAHRQVIAPATWRAIDLVSDLHLSEATPRTAAAFLETLRHTTADAVFILGDLVAYWVGDEQADEGFDSELWQALSEVARQRWVGFMVGNRDFLISPTFLAARGIHMLADPCTLDAFGQRWLLSHGDALCIDDQAYQAFRAQVRSNVWQSDFLARPLAERQALARQIRAHSEARKAQSSDPELWADVDASLAEDWLVQTGASTLIHGHTHRPGHRLTPAGLSIETLSDWDLDADSPAQHRAELVRLTGPQLRRVKPV